MTIDPQRTPPSETGRIVTLPVRIAEPAADSVATVRRARQCRRRIAFLFPMALIVVDALLVAASFFLAFRLRLATDYQGPLDFSTYSNMLLIQVGAMITTFFFYKLYQRRLPSFVDELGRLFAATSVGTVITLAATSFLFKNSAEFDYPRLMVFYAWGLTILVVAAGRLVHRFVQSRLQANGVAAQNVLVVGSGETAQTIVNALKRMPHVGYRVVGVVEAGPKRPTVDLSALVVGTVDEMPQLIDRLGVDEVIIGMPESDHRDIVAIINSAQRERVSIKVFPDLFQFMAGEMTIGDLNGLPLLTVRDIAQRGWKLAVKRGLDILLSGMGLIAISPLLLLVAILIKVESPGPVFFTQLRMGLDAVPFRIIKFRSMRSDAEKHATWTVENDPRVTRIGAFIRRTSLDELPQLINVLIGEMSLVGPRPEQPQYVEEFRSKIPRYMDRHMERAGMTGWAQLHGLRGDSSIFERTKYDLWYIENWSLTLDLKILLRTLIKAPFDSSAY